MIRDLRVATCVGIFVLGFGCSAGDTGIQGGTLKPCPDSPNCVSSYATDKKHAISPIEYATSRQTASAALISVLDGMKRCRVIARDDRYVHAEFRSRLFRFVDDVEFYFDENKPVIQVRSASRVGYSDFGVNRKRIETIRNRFYDEILHMHEK